MRTEHPLSLSTSRVTELLASAAEALQAAGISRPRWTAEQLLSSRLGCRPIELYLELPPVRSEQAVRFQTDVAARVSGVPLQYLTQSGAFYGRDFEVGPGVFIPRPETEILVEVALDLAHRQTAGLPNARPVVVDVGTGSRAIAVTLKLEQPKLDVVAIDRSEIALSFARQNAQRHHCLIRLLKGDLIDPLAPRSADLIVANLPYLDPGKAAMWPPELHWEPWLALDGGEGGLSMISALIQRVPLVLKPLGQALLEIGMEQASAVRDIAQENGLIVERVVRDLAGMDRVVVLKREQA